MIETHRRRSQDAGATQLELMFDDAPA